MYKYAGLEQALVNNGAEEIRLALSDIESVINDKLPKSALKYEAWWGNDKTHVQAKAWMDAGYRVADRTEPIELRVVTFSRLR